ncbi:MAG: hypothetical protein PHO26_04175 [Dehalococcoidia bacterium]|nr:hypothetical protein [Dehalococcoidia bacterium]
MGVDFKEFAQRACQSPISITIIMSEFSQLVDAVRDALIKTYPNLGSGEAFSYASNGFSLRCPHCGPFSHEVIPILYLAGAMTKHGTVIYGGPNIAALDQGRCPRCGGNMLISSFSPQSIIDHLEAEKREAFISEGISSLDLACTPIAYLGNINISPNEDLVCFTEPNGSVVSYDSGTDQLRWSINVPSATIRLLRFVSPERVLVLSEKQENQILIQLVNTIDGSVLAESIWPNKIYGYADSDPLTGLFVVEISYDNLLIINTANDKLELSTYKCGQIYLPGPKIGPDGKLYFIEHFQLYCVEGNQQRSLASADHCICFRGTTVYCGGGHSDRSGKSALHIGDLNSSIFHEIPWGNEPINEIAIAGDDRLLIANNVSEVHIGRYPNAVVTLFSIASQKKEWSLTIGDLKPWRNVILVSVPAEGWALIQTGKFLKRISLKDGKPMNVLPKQMQEVVTANWLSSRNLLYVARCLDQNKPGLLECYRI